MYLRTKKRERNGIKKGAQVYHGRKSTGAQNRWRKPPGRKPLGRKPLRRKPPGHKPLVTVLMKLSFSKFLWAFLKQPSFLIQWLAQQNTPRSCPNVF